MIRVAFENRYDENEAIEGCELENCTNLRV